MSKNIALYEHQKIFLSNVLGPTDKPTFAQTLEKLGDWYAEKIVLFAYNCNMAEMKLGSTIVSDCFLAGVFARMFIDKTTPTNDPFYVGKIEEILTINLGCDMPTLVRSTMDMMSVGRYEDIERKKEILLCQSLTHQISETANMQEMLTILGAVFMVGASVIFN